MEIIIQALELKIQVWMLAQEAIMQVPKVKLLVLRSKKYSSLEVIMQVLGSDNVGPKNHILYLELMLKEMKHFWI